MQDETEMVHHTWAGDYRTEEKPVPNKKNYEKNKYIKKISTHIKALNYLTLTRHRQWLFFSFTFSLSAQNCYTSYRYIFHRIVSQRRNDAAHTLLIFFVWIDLDTIKSILSILVGLVYRVGLNVYVWVYIETCIHIHNENIPIHPLKLSIHMTTTHWP